MPSLKIDDAIVIPASNRSQQRGSHGLFRYFGKLAPDVTGKVLDLAVELNRSQEPVVVDLMCGSGTTLIESHERGFESIGVDVNPVACLYANCKTQAIIHGRYNDYLQSVTSRLDATEDEVATRFSQTRNADRWFTPEAKVVVSALSRNIELLPDSREKNLLKATFLSRLRRISNASERTGRIFYDPTSAVSPLSEFLAAAERNALNSPVADLKATVIQGEARSNPIPDASADIVFLHPPYFALYRYSSDVLRFEMELGGFSRSAVAKQEIREGWKSGNPENLDGYLADMGSVFQSANRVLKTGGTLAVVASDSTLGDHQMPVIDGLAFKAAEAGFSVQRHFEREMHHGSASYHRSSRKDKVILRDHIVLLSK